MQMVDFQKAIFWQLKKKSFPAFMEIFRNGYLALTTSEDTNWKGILTKMIHHQYVRVNYLAKKMGRVTWFSEEVIGVWKTTKSGISIIFSCKRN